MSGSTYIPAATPAQAAVLLDKAADAERDALEPPEDADDGEGVAAKDEPLGACRQPAVGKNKVVEEVSEHEDGEPERRHVVVEVGDAAHDEEGDIVERPAAKRELEAKDELLPLAGAKIDVLALAAHQVADQDANADKQADA